MLKSLHLNFIYIPTICFVVEVCLIFSTHTLLFSLNSILCTCQPAVSLRQNSVTLIRVFPKVQLLQICSFVLLNLFNLISRCEPRIFALLERKREEATLAGHPLGVGSLWLSTYFFFRNFATYCSSLLDLRSNIFFVIFFFRFPALIFAYILMTHKHLHVFTFSTNPPKKALKKEIKSAKK